MNDQAAREAIGAKANLLPNGVEIVIDNQAVCFACQAACGSKMRPSAAHRRLERAFRGLERSAFFSFRGIPIHATERDGHEEELLTEDARRLNEGADTLASRGKVMNRPQQPPKTAANKYFTHPIAL